MVVVIMSLLHCGHGRTMVGAAMSPSARSLEEHGELQREVINENKKILARTLVHVRPRDSAALSSHCGCHCCWTVAGPWRERMCTSISKEGLRMGEHGELLREIANKKKKYLIPKFTHSRCP